VTGPGKEEWSILGWGSREVSVMRFTPMVFPSAGRVCDNAYLICPLHWRDEACAMHFSLEKDYNYGIQNLSLYLGVVVIACHSVISNKSVV